MPTSSKLTRSSLILCLVACALPFGASAAEGTARSTSGEDRLYLAFAEEASVVPGQWWEGRLDFTMNQPAPLADVDQTVVGFVGAFQPVPDLELGGRVGFGSASAPHPAPDGSGPTDMDLWGKWHLGTAGGSMEMAVGGLLRIPTGDNTAGLGGDAFGFEAFGSVRFRLPKALFSAHLGLWLNGDGNVQGLDVDGKNSARLGLGVIFPISDPVSIVAEAQMETERYEYTIESQDRIEVRDSGSDFRLLVGLNWRAFSRGTLRAAVGVGLTSGAADARLMLGYAYSF